MRSALLVVSLTVLVAGCDSGGPVVGGGPDPVIPLEVGAEWALASVYTVSFNADGTVRDTVRHETPRRDTLTVVRDTLIAGERWFLVRPTQPFQHCVFGQPTWFANREDGLYRRRGDDAELVYASGTAVGEPFLDTPAFVAVIEDPDATYALPSGPVPTTQYGRTWRRLDTGSVRGPIDPTVRIEDHLSADLGLVALQVSYVRPTDGSVDAFVPGATTTYELVSYTAP